MAVGLTWLAPVVWSASGREHRKTREILSLKMDALGYAQIDTSAGYQLGATANQQDLGLESAAALLACAQQSIVLVEHLEDDQYWLCSIEDGAIFPAGDLIGSKDLIAERLREICSDIAGTGIRIYDKSDFFGIENAIRQDFVDLVKNVTPNSDISCRPIQKKQLNKPALGIAIGFVFVCTIVGTWYQLTAVDSSEERQNSQMQASQHEFDQERLAVQSSLSQNSPALLATFTDTIYNRPLRAGGWRTQSYEWQDGMVSVTWHRDHGNILNISKHLENRQFQVIEGAGYVTEKFDFPALAKTESVDIEILLGDSKDRMFLLDSLATISGDWSLNTGQIIGNQFRVARSQLHGSGNQLYQMISTALKLKNQPVHLTRFKVVLGDSFHWELEGHYYADAN